MSNTKILASILLVLAVLFTQVGNVAAAPQTQETTPPQITEITTETDESGLTTVVVTLLLEDQTTQKVRISLDYAAYLGLVDSETQEPVLLEEVPDGTVIDPAEVLEEIPVEEPTEPDVHLISSLLADFFFDGDDEMASLIDSFHTGENEAEQVFGFGVIAQALWMSRNTDGDADIELAEDILVVKQTKEYDVFFEAHPEYKDEFGDTLPTNWGQFKKGLKEKKNNLGVVVSGQEEPDATAEPALTDQKDHDNGKDKQDKPKKDKKNNKP